MAFPVQLVGTVRSHDKAPVGIEDLNRAQRDHLEDRGGLAAIVLSRRYGERGKIRRSLEVIVSNSESPDIDRITREELAFLESIPALVELRRDDNPRYGVMLEDVKSEYLKLKKQRRTDARGESWRFRLPELTLVRCPKLDAFDPASGAEFYRWKSGTIEQLDRNNATTSHKVELVKGMIEKKFLFLLSHCQTVDEIFDILEQKVPAKSEICRYLEEKISLGGSPSFANCKTEMDLHKKAENVQVLLTELGLVEPDYDLEKSTVESCLLSFETSTGSTLEKARYAETWYQLKREKNQFMSYSLDLFLETFKSALAGASATRMRAQRLARSEEAMKASKQGSQKSQQKSVPETTKNGPATTLSNQNPSSSRRSAGENSVEQPARQTSKKSTQKRTGTEGVRVGECGVCSKSRNVCKRLSDCTVVKGWREKTESIPPTFCSLCCGKKEGDRHRFSPEFGENVCHWKKVTWPGTETKTINYCCKHKVSKLLCEECFKDTRPRNQFKQSSVQKRLSVKQMVASEQKKEKQQKTTSVILPTVFQLREKVWVKGADGEPVQVLLVYDSGADHSCCSENLITCDQSGQLRTANDVKIIGSVSNDTYNMRIIQAELVSREGERSGNILTLAAKPMSMEMPDPICELVTVPGAHLKERILEEDVGLPIIVLGIDNIVHHPKMSNIKSATHLPGLVFMKSDFTGKIIPVGRVEELVTVPDVSGQGCLQRRVQVSQEQQEPEKEKIEVDDANYEGNFCDPLSSLPAIKALSHDLLMTEIKNTWGSVEESAAVSNISKLGCMSCSKVPQQLLDKSDISFF